MRHRALYLACLLAFPAFVAGQTPLPNPLAQYISVDAPVVALEHVEVIDGTGGPAKADQTIVMDHGKIAEVGPAVSTTVPAGARVMDLTGHTVYPGLVGMHEHLFYPTPEGGPGRLALYGEMADSAPRLYLAGGVTSARTTGSIEEYTDISVKHLIDAGKIPGPELFLTSPYLEGVGAYTPNMHELTGPDDAKRMVDYWATEGITSYKAYMHITPAELKAAVDAAHALGLKVTGHLCAVGFKEAAALGLDNLEHGLVVDTEFYPGKKVGVCPDWRKAVEALAKMDVEGPQIQGTIKDLIAHHVAVTSTLAVFEVDVPNRPPLSYETQVRDAMTPDAWGAYVTTRAMIAERAAKSPWPWGKMLKMEMEFEHDFAKDGGLLMAGCDPTGPGGVVPGYCDERELELLVEAGFTPVEAIHIATENGAKWLGEEQHFGTIAVGKQADLVVVKGDVDKNIDAVENVETVFKKGVGFDSEKLRDSVRGLVGLR
ncbi:MAG: amidohydrolase family protein [Terracidiphilus sp.]